MHADRRQRDIPGEFRVWARGVASIDRSIGLHHNRSEPPTILNGSIPFVDLLIYP